MVTLRLEYLEKIRPKLFQHFGYQSIMQVPQLVKIVLNMGVKEAVSDKNAIKYAMEDLKNIAGQMPVITRVRKSVAAFKIREGWPIGCKVTLRRAKMYHFLQRLIAVAIPRIRDFRGFSVNGFDGLGNYSFGISEQIVFPEIDYDQVDRIRGLDVTLVTSTCKDDEAQVLLKAFGFPLRGVS